MKYPFIDLAAQQARIYEPVQAAIAKVLAHGAYILGPEVKTFEGQLAAFEHSAHAVGCANGTDALVLPMMAWGIGPGDAVFCPSFTYTATAEAIAIIGATPVFVDIDRETYNMCSESLAQAIEDVQATGTLTPKAVIAVDLFGQPADYPALAPIVREAGLHFIADCAQGLGCRLNGKSPTHWVDVSTTSFFPAKPLGCYGDGGAIVLNDPDLTDTLRSYAFHGRGSEPYDHDKIGVNSRLDTLQAAVLIEKLAIFPDEIKARNQITTRYSSALKDHILRVPKVIEGGLSTWAQYVIEVEDRDGFMARVKAQDIPVAAYYPRPTHLQTAYTDYPIVSSGLPNTESAMHTVAALPMHPYLDEAAQDDIIQTVIAAAS